MNPATHQGEIDMGKSFHEIEATPDQFREWLKKQTKRKFYCCDPYSCPIGAYTNVGVGAYTYGDRSCGIKERDMPEWAKRFVMAFDKLDRGSDAGINSNAALKILDEVWNALAGSPNADLGTD